MPKYWGKQIFSIRSFPEVGQKQKTQKKKKEKDRKLVIPMGKLHMAHASTHGNAWANKSCQTHFSYELITMTKTAALGPGSLQLILN